ncbi:hypothetical protein D3C78_1457850 [compost metagenome]
MKIIDILSSDLPGIDDPIKECVNLGQWLLFRSEEIVRTKGENTFCLKIGHSVYLLSERGYVISQIEGGTEKLGMDEIFYFSDLPRPHSLSNLGISRAI